MAFVLRIISKAKWIPFEKSGFCVGQVQADAMNDLKTKDNKLSIWILDEEKSNLERVVAAVASKREKLSKFDYAVFDLKLVDKMKIKREVTKGDSPDLNTNNLHNDLVELSTKELYKLANAIQFKSTKGRFLGEDVKNLIQENINKGNIDFDKMNQKIRKYFT